MWKPRLIPNWKGEIPNLEERLPTPEDWYASLKRDGGRVEIMPDGIALGRSLKPIKSFHIQRMVEDLSLVLQTDHVLEAEFYAHGFTFGEIMHFFRTEDVTSDKTKKKYNNLWKKTKGGTVFIYKKVEYPMSELTQEMEDDGATYWQFPGREPEWLCRWHDELKLYVFDLVQDKPKYVRHNNLMTLSEKFTEDAVVVKQLTVPYVDAVYQAFDQSIIDGYEGLVLLHKESMYKSGRATLKENTILKLKDDKKEYDGQIMEVLEGTYAREGAEKTVNELGRSVTSKKKEDRVPGGYCKGFRTRMDDGRELTVSLRGFDQAFKEEIWHNPSEFVGAWVRFTGMAPVKEGGVPRHAHCTPNDFRDEK
jgi:hypothetical protein